MAKVTIIGAGAMGSALVVPLLENGHQVRMWGTELDEEIIAAVKSGLPHPKHKKCLPAAVEAFYAPDLSAAIHGAELIIMAVTSDAMEAVFSRVVPYLQKGMVVGTVTKGFAYDEHGKIVILPELMRNLLPAALQSTIQIVAVGGPCKATELLWKAPTAVTYASQSIDAARYMKDVLKTRTYCVEATTDIVGTEVCAAMKNAYAVGLGMAEGFSQKDGLTHNNTKSALFTYAVREMGYLSLALGGTLEPVYGLPGAGDLEVTGEAGRNRILGEVIGKGLSAKQAIAKMEQEQITVEGYPAIRFGYNLVKQLEESGKASLQQFTLLSGLYAILYENEDAFSTLCEVMNQVIEV